MNNATISKIGNTRFYVEAFDPGEFRMGMPYSFLRILDEEKAPYIEFPKLRFFPGMNSSDFVKNYEAGVLSLQVLLSNEGRYSTAKIEIDLDGKIYLIKDVKNYIQEFKDINSVVAVLKKIENSI